MYLSHIAGVDQEWHELIGDAEDEDGEVDVEKLEELCLDKLHRWRTLQKLHTLRSEMGEDKWRLLWDTFPSVQACGFTDDEIRNMSSDVALSNRLS